MRILRKACSACFGFAFLVSGSGLFPNYISGQQAAPAANSSSSAFDVASLRIASHENGGVFSLSPWGSPQFTATNISLKILISLAYGVDSQYVFGIPQALEDTPYDVAARGAGDETYTYEQIHAPLQQLLKERLHLATHLETRKEAGYSLVTAKRGPHLKASGGEATYMYILPNALKAQDVPLKSFAAAISSIIKQPVVDETGIGGDFDFSLSFAMNNNTDSDLPSIFTAVEEQLGLKLKPGNVDQQVLIVDHVDPSPMAN